MNLSTLLTALSLAGGAFLAFNAGTPLTIRVVAAVGAFVAAINHVAQAHITARNADNAAVALGKTPPSAASANGEPGIADMVKMLQGVTQITPPSNAASNG